MVMKPKRGILILVGENFQANTLRGEFDSYSSDSDPADGNLLTTTPESGTVEINRSSAPTRVCSLIK